MKEKYFNYFSFLHLNLKRRKIIFLFFFFLISTVIGNTLFAQSLDSFSPSSACQNSGTSIIITGNNLLGITSVAFNGTTASSFSIDNATQITAVLPVGATSGTISISDGTSTWNSSDSLTIIPTVTPSVFITSDSGNTICAGKSVTFTATPTNGGTSPTYQWYIGTTPVGTNSSTFTTTSLANGNQVKVEMTSSANCPSPATVSSNSITMTVNPNLTPTVDIQSSQTTFCAGTSVTFSINSIVNGGLSPTYQWKVNGTNVGTNTNSYTTSLLAHDDIVTLDITSSENCASPKTITSNPIQVTVNPNLPVSVSVGASATTICAGTNVTFTATPTNGGTNPIYQWKLNGTNVGTNSSTYSNSALTNGDIVSVVLTSNESCTTGNPATSGNTTMTVNPNLPVSVSIGASATTICSGTNVTFTATPTNGGTTPIYQWKLNGSNVGTNSNTYSNSTLANGDIVTVTLTSNATCATGNPATSANTTMTVNPNLPVSVSVGASATTICAGTNVTFTATPTNGGTNPIYQWKLNGSNVGTNSSTYSNSTLANGDIVTVTLTSNATCATGNPATSGSTTMTVNPNLPVSVSVGASATTICAGTNVTFTATPTNGGTTPIYQWKLNGSNVGTNSSTYSNSTLANGDIVTVTVTSNATCATGNPATSGNTTMTVNPNLPVSVSIGASATTICAGTNVTFTATPTNGGTNPIYQWKLNGSNVGTNSSTYSNSTLANGDIVTVTVTSNATCATGNPATSGNTTMTVNPNLPVSVSVGASATTICAGTNVTFTATPTNGGTNPIYQWKLNGSNVGTNSSTYSNSTLANGDIVTVTLISNATCATGNPATSGNTTMTVNPNLPVSVSVGASATTICAGTNVTFTATPTNGGTNPIYQWKLNGSNVGTNSSTYSNSTLANGDIVTVTVTSNATCATGNPATSGNTTMTVNPNLPVSVSVGASATTICAGTNVTFTATPTNGGTNPIYQWKLNGSNVGTNSSTYSNSTLANGDIVTVTLTSNATCATGNPAISGNTTMIVNPNATISLTSGVGSNNQTRCINTAINNITFGISGGGTGATVSGLPPGLTTNYNAGTYTVSGAPSASGTFNYTVTTTGTCTQATATGTITVNPDATMTLTSAPSTTSQNICRPSAITNITYNVTGATSINSIGLPSGVNAVLSAGIVTISGTPAAAGTYNYTINTTSTCVNTSVSGTIVVWNGSPTNWTGGNPITMPSSVCPPATINITTTAVTNTQYYTWTLPAGFSIISGTGTNNIMVSVSSGATIGNNQNVTVQAFNPCGNNNSKTDKINVNTFNGVTVNQSTQDVCNNGSIAIIGTLTGNAASGTWSAPSGAFSNIVTSGTNPITVSATYTPSISSGNVTLTITTNAPSGGGCPNVPGTATVDVTVNEPSVAPTSISAATSPICNGSSTTLTQTGGSLGTGASWKWYSDPSFSTLVGTSAAANASLSVSPTTTTTYYLRAESTTGAPCTANVSAAGSVTVTVNQNSIAPTSLIGTPSTICNGNSTTLTQTGGSLGTGASWKWYSDASFTTLVGTSAVANASLSVSPSTTTTYYLRAESTTGAPCTANVPAAGSVTITVNQNSVAPTSLSAATSPICNGSSTTLTQTGGSLGTGSNWKWYSDASFTTMVGTSAVANASLSVSPTTTTTYYLRAESTTGAPCTANVAAAGSVTVTVNQNSVAPSSLIGTPATICNGNSTTLTQTGGSLGTGASWKWYSDAGYTTLIGTSAVTNASLSVSPTTTTTYYLRAESTSGAPCTANVPAAGSVTITVNQNSVAPTSLSAATSPICNGSSTTLTQTGGSLGTGANWKWYSDASFTTMVGTSAVANASLSVSPTTTTTYYLRAESTTGAPCTANVAAAGSVTVTVNQNSVAPSSLIGTSATICNGNNTTLTQTGGSLGTGASWNWYSDASFTTLVGTSAVANASLSVSPTTTTTYYLRAESTTGAPCTANVPAAGSVTVTVNQNSIAPSSLIGTPSTICNGNNTTLTQTGGSLGTGANWKWYSDASFTTLVGTSAVANASLSVSPTTTTTYYLRAESTTGAPCTANVSAAGSVTVTVNQNSVAPSSLIGTPSTICNGNNTTLTQTGGSLGTGASWNWYSDASFTTLVGTSAAANASLSVSPTITTTYYLRAESTSGAPCTANVAAAGSVTITVNQSSVAPTSLSAATSPICNGSSTTLTQTGGSLGTGASWKWYSDASFTTLIGTSAVANASLSVSPTTTTTYYLRAESTTGAPCTANVAAAGSVTVTVNQNSVAPSSLIGTPSTICNGNSTTLTQTGGSLGTGASWNWYSDASFTTLVGTSAVANASLSVSPTTTTTYYLRAESTTGAPCTANVTAAGSVTITVNDAVAITVQPTASQTVCTTSNVSFNVTATGTGLTYQWRKGTTNLSNTGNITGATTATLNLSNVASSDAGSYNVIISGTSPCSSVTSSSTVLTVNRKVVIGTQPTNVGICASSPAQFGVVATGDGLTYQWFKGTYPGTAVTNTAFISGAQSNILNFSQAFLTDAGVYYVEVSGASPCSLERSTEVTLNIDQSINITTQPVSQALCTGTNSVTFSVFADANGDSLNFQWRKNGSNIGGVITSTSTATLTLNNITSGDAGNYDVVISGPVGYTCPSVTSTSATLTVNPLPTISGTLSICGGFTSQLSGTASPAASNPWISSNPSVATVSNTGLVSALSIGTSTITYTNNNGCMTTATVTVTETAQVNQPVSQVLCNNNTTSNIIFTTSNSSGTTTYSWTNDTPAIGLAASGTGNINSFTATNSGTSPVTATIIVTPIYTNGSANCNGPTKTFTITVNPTAQVNQPANQVICNGGATTVVSFGTTNTGGITTYSWTNSNTNIGLATSGNTDISSFTATNSGTTPITATITVTPTFNNGSVDCLGPTKSFTITVNPTAQVNQPANQVVCNGSSTTIVTFGTNNTGGTTSYSWTNSNTAIGLAATGSSDIAAITATNLGTSPITATITVTPTFNNGSVDCTGPTKSFTITVNPTAQVNQPANQVVCNGSPTTLVSFGTTNTGGTTTYSWTNTNTSIGLAASGSSDISAFTATNLGTAPTTATIVVTPTFNNGSVSCVGTAKTFTITVNPTAQVNQPANQIVCNSSSTTLISFGTNNTGGTTTYSWTNDNSSIGLASSGSGNIAAFTATNSGTFPVTATIVVTPTFNNGSVNCTGTTKTFTITVNPTAQVNQPVNQVVCNGNPTTLVSFGTNNTVGTTTYSWTNTTTSIGLAASGSSDISSFTAINSGTAPITATIVVTPTYNNGTVNCTGPTKTFTITVNPTAQVNQPANQVVCNGGSTSLVSFGTNNTGGTTTYSWTNSNTAIGLAASGTSNIAAFSATNTGTSPIVATITVTPSFNNGSIDCTGPTKTFTITVNPTAQVNQPSNQVVCNGSSTTLVSFGTTNTGGTTTYSWTNSNTAIGLAASGTGNIAAFSATNLGTSPIVATIVVTPTFNNGSINCTGPTKTLTITVNPAAQVNQPASQVICNGNSTTLVSFGTTNTGGTTTYSWTNSNTAIGLATSGTGNIAAFSATNLGTSPIVATIVVTPTFNNGSINCTGPTKTFTITVNPTAQVNQPSNQVVCNGTSTSVNFGTTNSGGTTTYSWTNNNTSIGLAASGTGNIAAFTATNTGTSPVTATIVVTPTFNNGSVNCIGTSKTFTITIDPTSNGGNLTGYATDQSGNPYNNPIVYSKNLIACESTDGLIVLNGQTGNIIRWEYSTDGGTNWTTINNTTNSYAYSSIPQTRIYRAVIQSGVCGIAYSNIVTVSVVPQNIKPTPVTVSKTTMCLGDTTVFTATSGFATGQNIQGGEFNTGQFPDKFNPDKWRLDGVAVGNAWTASADNTKTNNWAGTNGHPFGTYPIFYDSLDKKFAIANGNLSTYYGGTRDNTTLETPRFNTYGLTTSVLEVDMAWNLELNDYAKIELSLNGGVSYNIVLFSKVGKTASTIFNPLQKFSFDLSDYVGQQDLRVRFTFKGTTVNSAWALDNIKLPTPPVGPDIVWTDENQNIISTATTYSETPTTPGIHNFAVTSFVNGCVYDITPQNTVYITVNVNYSYAGKDQVILAGNCGNNTVSLNAYDNRKTANENISNGAFDNNYQPGDQLGTGATGKWTIKSTSSSCGTGTFSDDTSPNATFTGEAGVYVLTWTTGGCTDDVQITLTDCNVINFDGINDNVTFKNNYNLTPKFTVEAWVKPNSVTGTQTIFSKRDANNLSTGYDLKLNGDIVSFNWNSSGTIVSNYSITTNRWYHIAVTFDGGLYRLFIDGIEVSNPAGISGVQPSTNTFDCILGAMSQTGSPPNNPVNYFNGWIDELRIWDINLNLDQLHQMMNQEIISSPTVAGNVQGAIIPIDVNGLSWTTNLLGYYQMNNISCGHLNPNKGTAKGKLRNITTAEDQTAPIPYTTIRNGNWKDRGATTTPWLYGSSVWDYPNSTGVNGAPIDWNIVVSSNNLNNDDKDITLLGFIMNTGTQLDVHAPGILNETNTGHMLWITHYLKLNGFINLIGESQLLQKRYYSFPNQFSESIFEEASTGYIKRDQQGKQNSFNYNYWTSPVSIRGNANNSPYNLDGVLRDGTTSSSPKVIQFNGNAFFADGPITSPIKISTRWVWSYNSKTLASNSELDNYYLWNHIYNYGMLNTGEGFTMKGTGGTTALSNTQNYAFMGKPNSGTITLGLPLEQTYLVGNPYPSALDADEFIKDNLKDCVGCRASGNVFNGALYYWDHLGITGNHELALYEGGYATYTLMGGTVATVDGDLNSQSGNKGTKKPGPYIPIAQGFFVDAALETSIAGSTTTVQGGSLVFKNSQRIFYREDSTNSIFMKPSTTSKTKLLNETDTRPKIRLGYNSTAGKHRQLLIGADKNTTDLFDIGYDAPMFDLYDDDLYWSINNSPFTIQAIPNFDSDQIIPLGMIIKKPGESTIKIDELENIPNDFNIYIHDNETSEYHNLREQNFSISLPAGKYTNRFSLRFSKEIMGIESNELKDDIKIYFTQDQYTITIKNQLVDTRIKKVYLFNTLGQILKSWGIDQTNQENIQLPLKKLSSGVYFVKTKTDKGYFNTTIIVK
ncbi:T9SS type A sorting domain-containing protein [Flavobacterium sp. NG2]|uniref:Ig-like domain-containing protein n=1 Tax=Flavobacterium sp. NG2 TaxID=3097547 RepID=UPI002A837C15|nr:Ig-like domain-containing protein [Flavobacterium sp. NG2]WPR71173.1 T9SS type A sorting domain-containing protein [Flavobacterium sp. NG2]